MESRPPSVSFVAVDLETTSLADVDLPGRAMQIAELSGEPMKSFYRPDEIGDMLERAGSDTIELLDASALAARYGIATDRLPGATAFAIATA